MNVCVFDGCVLCDLMWDFTQICCIIVFALNLYFEREVKFFFTSNSYILFFCCWAFCCRSSSVAVVVWDYCCGGFVGSSRDCFAFRAVFFGISSGDSQPFYLAYLLLLLPEYGLDDWTWSWAEWMYSQFVFVFICCFVFHAFIYL